METQRLPTSELRLDAALPWDLFDATGHLLWRKGCVLERNAQISALIERGVYVRPDDFKRFHYPLPSDVMGGVPNLPPPKVQDPFRLRTAIDSKLALLLREANPDAGFVGKVRELLPMIRELIEHTADAALAQIFLHTPTKYAVAHSVDVAVLAEMLSRRLDWSEAQRDSVVCGALTMNIAMLDAQIILSAQRMPPTEAQRATIATHPAAGVAMLRAAGVMDEQWLEVVGEHHEVPDGSGYPTKKTTQSEAVALVRLLDTYCAIITPRADRKAVDAALAAKTLLVREGKLGNNLPGLLIKELGIHPPGTVVKLKGGDTAVVSRRPSGATPLLVHSFLNSHGIPMLEPMWRDTSKAEFAVVSGIARGAIKLPADLEKIWGVQTRH